MKKVEELKLYAPEPKRPELDAALCMSVAEGQGCHPQLPGKGGEIYLAVFSIFSKSSSKVLVMVNGS